MSFARLTAARQPVGLDGPGGRSSVVERQLPKLYVEGSIPFARSRFFKQVAEFSVMSPNRQREQDGKFREQNGALATKSPEKVPSYVRLMFLRLMAELLAFPSGRGLGACALGTARQFRRVSNQPLRLRPFLVTIPDAASVAHGELQPGALGPASRLRRRYADAPAGAPRCAPSCRPELDGASRPLHRAGSWQPSFSEGKASASWSRTKPNYGSGGQDRQLPNPPTDLVRREEAHAYPTDFNAMPSEWIDRLSLRGEQLTLCLARAYIPDLVVEPSLTRA